MSQMKKSKFGSLQIDLDPYIAMEDFQKAPKDHKESEVIHRESVSYWSDAWRKLKANTVAMIALVVIIVLFIFAYIGPLFVEYSYEEQVRGSDNLFPMQYSEKEMEINRLAKEKAINPETNKPYEKVFPHFFGTDNHGRDILVRVMYGTRISMAIGVFAALLVLVIGSVYGSISGYIGGRVDNIMMRIVEVIYAVPEILVVLLLAITIKPTLDSFAFKNINNALGQIVNSLGSSVISIFIAFALLYWVTMARIIRGQVLQLKEQEFILAAKAVGASTGRIIRKHLLPNSVGAMVSATCLQIPSAIFLESFLSFLGLGVQAPMTSLGSMASDALGGIYTYTYRLIIPSVILSLMILSFNLFGDGLRDALDPRMED